MYCSAFRAFEKMTISGTGEFKNNINTYSEGAVLLTNSGPMLLTGDATNLTFTGTKYKDEDENLSVGYDLNASNITFEGTGTYSLGGGIRSGGTVTINGSNVTLTADSKSYINGKTLLQAGTLTIESANYKTSTVEVSDGATLYLKNTLPSGLTNNGKTILYTATPTITNLASTATTGTFEWDSSVTGTKSLTLNNTADTTYAGALPDVSSITKTGDKQFKLTRNLTIPTLTVKQGTFAISGNNENNTPYSLSGDALIDGGTLSFESSDDWTVGKQGPVVQNGKIYVSAAGGTLAITGYRARVDGLYKPDGVETCGTLRLNSSGFFVGNSTFNGWLEVVGGTNRFSDEATKSAKGIILNGGTVQYLGDYCGATVGITRSLSQNFYLKNSSSFRCGWGESSFYLNGSITDWEGADLTGKYLNISTDSGYVIFNGEVNTKAMLTLYDNAKIGGANNVTFGGLNGSNTGKGLTLVSASTAKNLTLNVAVSTAPSFSSQLTGAFNLVKEGAGTQTFATVGIGSETAPLNSITINEGSVKMTDNAPIYTNSLTVNADGKLEFGTGNYNIQTGTLEGTGEISLAFTSDTDYTTLDFSGSTFTTASSGLLSLNQDSYKLEQFKEYSVARNFPNLGADFDYKSLLKGSDNYYFNLNRDSAGTLLLQMDNNAVPEPAAWVMILMGILIFGGTTSSSSCGRPRPLNRVG